MSPLLFKEEDQRCEGWFPIYSIENGISGELFTDIQLHYTPDLNTDHLFTSQQIDFFSSKAPVYFEVKLIIGFVEELVIFDKSKSNNDLDDQISLQEGVLKLRRRLCRIVLKKGGNAIITYR